MTNPHYGSRPRPTTRKSKVHTESIASQRGMRKRVEVGRNRFSGMETTNSNAPRPPFDWNTTSHENGNHHDSRDALEDRSRGIDIDSAFPVDSKAIVFPSEATSTTWNDSSRPVSPEVSVRVSPDAIDHKLETIDPFISDAVSNNVVFEEEQPWPPSAASMEESLDKPRGFTPDTPLNLGDTIHSSENTTGSESSSWRPRPLTAELIEDNHVERRRSPEQASSNQLNASRVVSPEPRRRDPQSEESSPFSVTVRVFEKRDTPQQRIPITTRPFARHDDDVPVTPIPALHAATIQKVFGEGCDLYRDVLLVDSRNATDSQIRVAFFRRGRQVLAEAEGQDKRTSANAKATFHAVTLAFEIVSRPDWKASYDTHGWGHTVDIPLEEDQARVNQSTSEEGTVDMDCEVAHVESSVEVAPEPILRPRVRSLGLRNPSSAARSVQWSEEVEELIFRPDPCEHEDEEQSLQSDFSEDDSLESEKASQRHICADRKKSQTIGDPVSSKALTERRELENTFMDTFLNDIDASLDGLEASLSGIIKGKSRQPQKSSNKAVDSLSPSPSAEGISVGSTTVSEKERTDSDDRQTLSVPFVESKQHDNPREIPRESLGNHERSLISAADQGTSDDRVAELLFSSLTKPLPSINIPEKPGKRHRSRSSHPQQEFKALDDDAWLPVQPPIITSAQKLKSREFEDAFDPFADISFVQETVFDKELEQPGFSGLQHGRKNRVVVTGAPSPSSHPRSKSTYETFQPDTSIDTGILDPKCSTCNRSGNDAADQAEVTALSEETSFLMKHSGAGCDACTAGPPSRKVPVSQTDQGFFSGWVTYMGKMQEDLNAISSHMTEGANQMVNSTQQVLADTFLLPDDKVDQLLDAVSSGFKEDREEPKPAVSRANTY